MFLRLKKRPADSVSMKSKEIDILVFTFVRSFEMEEREHREQHCP
jgi:hypothetical protein